MCGIIGCISSEEVAKTLLKGLKRLEYRGYDSCGMLTMGDNGSSLKKDIGSIDKVNKKLNFLNMPGNIGISHTRWATTGKVTELNSHPHFNTSKTIFTVHNGIIENYQEIKKELIDKGYNFITETDTEVIPFFFEDQLKQNNDMKTAMSNFIKKVKGTFAILILKKGEDKIYALKRDSPLTLGICNGKTILGSDIYAFSDETNKAIFFDDNEFAIITKDNYQFFNQIGLQVEKKITEFEWTREEETKEAFDHYMLKEIKEQPTTSIRLVNSFTTTQNEKLDKFAELIKQYKRIVFVACGTAYYAALIGSILLNKLGYYSRAIIASEMESFVTFDENTLAIAISQSGETMDVVTVIKEAKKKGSKVLSAVNVPFSTIQRWSDLSMEIMAGQEICVASTKAFTNQIIIMLGIAQRLGYNGNKLIEISNKIQETIDLNEEKIKKLAEEIYQKNDVFVLGKGLSYPVAREIALKLKEISYMHAEGMMGGELKHGTIALVEEGTPIICLIPNNNLDMISATKEVEARGANIIAFINKEINHKFNTHISLPESCDAEFAIYSCILGHLLSYYVGVLRGNEIDKPRNLAKSVTVH